MYFDRFDICEAHYVFAMLWHGGMGSKLYSKFAQFERIRFSPSPLLCGPEDLTENARDIYNQLVAKHCGDAPD